MSREPLFNWGSAYLLTDQKDGVFIDEPAIYVGKKGADMQRPSICAVCGEPLGATGYHSFYLMGPNGRGQDMMMGSGCVRERILSKELKFHGISFRDTWNWVIKEFPNSGRWYGVFLHHSIAKPYVRNRKVSEKWDESVLDLPGVKYIMGVIDELRDEGWDLTAEMRLECGNVDLLATHSEKGTLVFDWKSDLSFDNRDAYVDQVVGYMSELNSMGWQRISGYILWIRDGRKEPVPFKEVPVTEEMKRKRPMASKLPIKCTLNIDMGGGDGIRRKRITEYSHHRVYGDEVHFFIPSCKPSRHGYYFKHFEASPYREDQYPQAFYIGEVEDGFHLSFICSKKRHTFNLTAVWKKARPFKCSLTFILYENDFFQTSMFLDLNLDRKLRSVRASACMRARGSPDTTFGNSVFRNPNPIDS